MKEFILVVGLGNPGSDYQNTRHNLGERVVEYYQRQTNSPAFAHKPKLMAEVSKSAGSSLILSRPTTYMNDSGQPVKKLQDYFKIPISNILVVYDDADIEFGSIRTSQSGSSAGHKGIDSIIKLIGADFCRLRIGIGHPRRGGLDSYVLKPFSHLQRLKLKDVLSHSKVEIDQFIAGCKS